MRPVWVQPTLDMINPMENSCPPPERTTHACDTIRQKRAYQDEMKSKKPRRMYSGTNVLNIFIAQHIAFASHHKHLIAVPSVTDLQLINCISSTSWFAPQLCVFIKMDGVMMLASGTAVVIFSKSSCCMCHAIKSLFYDLGVSPAIYELDEEPKGREMEKALQRLGCNPSVPAVFIGGQLVNSANTVMSLHLSGRLVPMLKEAGAIWL
ncbi:Glutaredoxin-c1 [Thalictrum thalictroides]|uniref:Glutaredoxin-c1 n=1 Tax=Thalictrum thalictroides TaxID=46969 RepID=A0A7J6VQ14_THATH|nr:Glutaredoxin-c1 [Thalictrum thalictroides]